MSNLSALLTRGALHAPNWMPNDGLAYRTIHKTDVQVHRRVKEIHRGPGGTIHDYVPFYFGPLSVMLLNLKTGRVPDYREGQEPLIYLLTTAQSLTLGGCRCVFSDGHGLAGFTQWYDDLARLDRVDWGLVRQRYWADSPEDNDRQRRKQAEFLVWRSVDWSLIRGIAVLNEKVKGQVLTLLARFPHRAQPPVSVEPGWYY